VEVGLSTFLSGSKMFASNSSRFIFRRIKKMPSPIKAITAIPPTTPPIIAPIGGGLELDASVVEPVGTMTRVVVTTCPEELVVTYCEENIEETSLVTIELEVGGTVAVG
jgi:hypothetical protein